MFTSKSAEKLIGKAQEGKELNRKEIIQLLTLPVNCSPELFYAADKVRKKQAGANRYLLKHETASKDLYKYLRPGCNWQNRLQCLRRLKELGFETGTGNMVGLPGQTPEINYNIGQRQKHKSL